jgi:hypothetical protein
MNTSFEKYRGTQYDFSDTSKMRGTWFKMLIDAAKADGSTREERIVVCGQIRTLCEYFQCLKCKAHFIRRLESSPPEMEIDKKDGLFNWTINFANAISIEKGKEEYDMKIIYPMFHSSAHLLCDSGCDGSTSTQVGQVRITYGGSRQDTGITYGEGDRRNRRQDYSELIR